MKNIRLTTPAQDENENPAVELDPAILKNWLNSLSSDDIIATVKCLDTALSAFNEIKVPADKRHKLLETYFAGLQKLLHGYDEMRLAQLHVSAKQKQQLRNDIVWLYIKLSHGYKIIIKDIAQGESDTLKPQELLLTTFRALELTVIGLLHAYRFGLDTPPLTFLELNQLYAFAEYKDIVAKPVKTAKGYAKTPTISSFYALTLVFTSIDPTQYETYTLEVLFLALQPFLFNCRFNHSLEPGADSFIYKINLQEDLPPTILPDNQPLGTSEGIIYLDIGNFISEIETWLESNQNNKNTFLVEDELALFPNVLEKLNSIRQTNASIPPETSETPSETKSVRLVFGLQPLASILIMKSIDMDLKLDYKTSEWEIVSVSPTHYELTCQLSGFHEALTLGDLVSIVDCDEDGQLKSLNRLTHISGLQQLEDGKLLVRLEIIDGLAQAATYSISNESSDKERSTQYNGIYMTAKEGDADLHVLIADRSHSVQSQQLLFSTHSRCFSASILETIKETPSHVFWKIKILEDQDYGLRGCPITSLAS